MTAPPLHPWCRCVLVPHFAGLEGGERAARNEEGKTERVENQTYEEWKEQHVSKKPAPQPEPAVEEQIFSAAEPADLEIPKGVEYATPFDAEELENPKSHTRLTDEELTSVRYYTGSGFKKINTSLRSNELNEEIIAKVEAIDAALAKGVLEKGTYFYRGGIPAEDFFGVSVNKLSSLIGKEVSDPSYASTSALRYIAQSSFQKDPDAKVMAKIFVPAGKGRGMYLEPISKVGGECEFLIARNSVYQILDVYKEGRDTWVIMKLKV